MFFESLRLSGLLSFAPDSETLKLAPLNVVLGPNGSGKSNLIEGIELLRALPTSLTKALCCGGDVREWLWKGEGADQRAEIHAVVARADAPPLYYDLLFTAGGPHAEILGEGLKDYAGTEDLGVSYAPFYCHRPPEAPRILSRGKPSTPALLHRLAHTESVLALCKNFDRYPELTWLGFQLQHIQVFREGTFGQSPQPWNASSLALRIQRLEHVDGALRLKELLRRFLPRFKHFSTPFQGDTLQLYLHEEGLKAPIPASRLSAGTLRFLSILVLLLQPEPVPLLCIESPELGLHPDALSIIGELLLEARARTQLIVTTHSEALISALSSEVESVVVCEYHGGTVLRRLEAPRLAHWLDKHSLGDLWTMGELGGNP